LPVTIQKEALSGLSLFPVVAVPLLEAFLTLVFVVVLIVFILLRHEDLRDRLIQLAGRGQMALTATALDEAGDRIGRLMLRQLCINICFGAAFWLGLAVIGVPYAFLWGFLACLLRFVPYIGTSLAVCFPLVLSFAVFPSWSHPLYVLGLFLVLECITAYVIEPILFSDTTGASPIALLVAAAFWTWLWGPFGLILSAPLTVCLVILGRYVPQLKFFDLLMSPRVILPPPARYYQRLLAHNRDEATELLDETLHQHPEDEVYDQFLIPALALVREDERRGEIDQPQEDDVLKAMQDVFEGTMALQMGPETVDKEQDGERTAILGCAVRDLGDGVALRYFSHVLKADGTPLEVAAPDRILTAAAEHPAPTVVVLVAAGPGGFSEMQALCRRLRGRVPGSKVLVGWWGHADDRQKVRDSLMAAGASAVGFSLRESRDQVRNLPQLPRVSTAARNNQGTGARV
jgi:hypothetical protein